MAAKVLDLISLAGRYADQRVVRKLRCSRPLPLNGNYGARSAQVFLLVPE